MATELQSSLMQVQYIAEMYAMLHVHFVGPSSSARFHSSLPLC